jgi:transposase
MHGENNMWTETTRRQYRRDDLRYASDMTDAEWALIEPLLPAAKRLGRPRCVALRAVVEALLDLLRTASPWRLLPHDFPNRSTVQRYFYAWQAAGLWETINFLLLQQARERAGREARPSAGVIDSQSAKTTESGGPRGFDAGKKINRRKRHIITDTAGYLVAARVHAADIQDRDGAPDLLASIRYRFPWLRVMSSPIAVMPVTSWPRRSLGMGNGGLRSSSAPIDRLAFTGCHGAGWLSEPLPGSIATAGLPRTSRPRRAAAKRGYTSLRYNCSCAVSLDLQLIELPRKHSTIYAIPGQALSQLSHFRGPAQLATIVFNSQT